MSIDFSEITDQYIRDLSTLPDSETSLDAILEKALLGDRELRRLFASSPQDPRLSVLHCGLIDLFSIPTAALRTRERHRTPTSQDCYGYMFPLPPSERRIHLSPSTVPTFEAFHRCWELFSHRILMKLTQDDWENVIVGGGSVLAALMAQFPMDMPVDQINKFYLGEAWGTSDIDLFIWGLSASQAIDKIRSIYSAICEAAIWPVTCVRKANVLSFHTHFPFRPVQIVLRLYDSPAQVLAGFDVDAACCAFDGRKVWVNPRSLTAIIRQANSIDISRRSPSYEMRLAKYAERGFEVYLPSLDRARVRPALYDRSLSRFPRGLARLLVLEKLYRNGYAYDCLKFPGKRVAVEKNVTLEGEDPLEGVAWDTLGIEQSWYDPEIRRCRVPYGPGWDADRIEKTFRKKNEFSNSTAPWNRVNGGRDSHRHVVFAGALEDCISGTFCERCAETGVILSSSTPETDRKIYIQGPLRFIIKNPGAQLLTGSFQPINDEEWEAEAYISSVEEEYPVDHDG